MRIGRVLAVALALLCVGVVVSAQPRSVVHGAVIEKKSCHKVKRHGRLVKVCKGAGGGATSTTMYTAHWGKVGLNGWSASGAGNWSVSGKVLNYDGTGESTIIAPYQSNQPDYYVQAQIQFVKGPATGSSINEGDSFGILFRASGPFDPSSATTGTGLGAGFLHFSMAGSDLLSYITIMTIEDNADIYNGHADFKPGNAAHLYRLEVRGNSFKILVDGHEAVNQPDVNRFFDTFRVGLFSLHDQIRVRSFSVGPLA